MQLMQLEVKMQEKRRNNVFKKGTNDKEATVWHI